MNMNPLVVILLIAASGSYQKSAAQELLEKFSFPPLSCSSYKSVCAKSRADKSFTVRSKAQCIYECQHEGERSTCVGVNYRRDANVCEVYNECPAYYSADETGCQYLQREMTAYRKKCLVYLECNKTSVYVIPGNAAVTSITSYKDQLFVSRISSFERIAIYDSTNFQRLRNITIAGTAGTRGEYYGMATSLKHNLLFVSDYHERKVYALNLPLNTTTDDILPKTSWLTTSWPVGLSVNGANNVLVAMAHYIEEYAPNGTRVRQTPCGSTDNFQGIELLDGALAVCSYRHLNAVRIMLANGTVLKSYGNATRGSGPGQLSFPQSLAVDRDGFMLVGDWTNNRVLVLNPLLSEARLLPTNVTRIINAPRALWLDQSKGRLYVGEFNPTYRVLVFTDMFNIGEKFKTMKPVQ